VRSSKPASQNIRDSEHDDRIAPDGARGERATGQVAFGRLLRAAERKKRATTKAGGGGRGGKERGETKRLGGGGMGGNEGGGEKGGGGKTQFGRGGNTGSGEGRSEKRLRSESSARPEFHSACAGRRSVGRVATHPGFVQSGMRQLPEVRSYGIAWILGPAYFPKGRTRPLYLHAHTESAAGDIPISGTGATAKAVPAAV